MLTLCQTKEVTGLPTLPGNCPFCSGAIDVTAFACRDCDAAVEGRFAPNKLAALDGAQADFVLAFVRNRGNIKELERELGISYPTVRWAFALRRTPPRRRRRAAGAPIYWRRLKRAR